MTDELEVLDHLPPAADHVITEQALVEAGWTHCGVGDWAVVLASPSGTLAARVSPFDPVAAYAAELFEQAASTGSVPVLHAFRLLAGGATCTVMERLLPLPPEDATRFFEELHREDGDLTELGTIFAEVLDRARAWLPWCRGFDSNPSNVMQRGDGRPVLTDPFLVDGPGMYASILTDPLVVARSIPSDQRRHMLELPLAESGPWDPVEREKMRAGLAWADAQVAGES